MSRQLMPKQEPKDRRHNFHEVALGYTKDQALAEAQRCLNCRQAFCTRGCPVEIDIPGFIAEIKKENFQQAEKIIKAKNSLPAICGRVCPQESQCEKECILGRKGEPVAIGSLERFVADWEYKPPLTEKPTISPQNYRVAVIGSGPAGLTAAADLACQGFQVTLLEALHAAGGVLHYGIPEFRLPKKIVAQEIAYVQSLGVELQTSVLVGRTITIKELLENGYAAIFISSGAGLPYFLNIPGENLNGVYAANEFLTRVNLMKAYQFPKYETPVRLGKRVAVVGAGNVAMDAARTALRLGAEEVTIVYRRSLAEMPARLEEIENAQEEGIRFRLLTNPIAINGNDRGQVTGMQCVAMALGEPDSSGRQRPEPVPNSEFSLAVDNVIVAIGQGPNPVLLQTTPELKLNKQGYIQVDPETMATSIPGVYAGGDIVTGAATVIAAMGAAKKAARQIAIYCNNQAAESKVVK